MEALMIFGAPLVVLGAVALLYLLDRRPVDARRSRAARPGWLYGRNGRYDGRSW